MKRKLLKIEVTKEMLFFFSILFLIEFVRGALLLSFMPIYGNKVLHFSLDVIGAAITAHYVADTAVKLMMGYLLDRFSVRTVVSLGAFLCFLGVFSLKFTFVPWMFIVGAAIFGFGISPIWIVCLTKIKEDQRGLQMGLLYSVWLLGLGGGPIITNILLDHDVNFTYFFLTTISLMTGFICLFVPSKNNLHLETVPFGMQLKILGQRMKHMKPLLPGMVLQTLGAGMLLPVLPLFATEHLKMNASHYSALLTIGGVFTVLGLIPMGKLSDLYGKKWFLILGFLSFGFVLLALTQHPPLALSLFWAFLLGLSYSAVLPAWNSLLAAYIPPGQSGLGWGILSTVEGIGGIIGPIIGGLIGTGFGSLSVIVLTSFLFMGISLFYVFFPLPHLQKQA